MKSDTKRKKGKWAFLSMFFGGIVVICIVCLIWQYANENKIDRTYQELQVVVNVIETEEAEINVNSDEEEKYNKEIISVKKNITYPKKSIEWDKLYDENSDIYAWLYVSDTTIDYPIVQHSQDNMYYLEHNMDGTKGYPGCIYTENYNSKDFSDNHTVIYGHNLKNGTMFAPLHEFEDENKIKEDRYIYIYTEEKTYVYQIFAAYEYNNIHLLANYDLTNQYVYEQYIKDIYNLADTSDKVVNVREDIIVTKEDKIITLSTCTNNSDTRFLVVGVLLNP